MKSIVKRIAAAVLAMGLLGACSSGPTMVLNVDKDGKSFTAEFNRSDKDDFVGAGSLIIAEGESLSAENNITKGSASLKLIPQTGDLGMDASPEQITASVSEENVSFEAVLSGSGTETYEIEPGEYFILITALEKTSGSSAFRTADR